MRHVLFGALFAAGLALADSPLTSTDFATAYRELPMVKAALDAKGPTPEVLQFLVSDAPNDQKLAVANALGWGKGNAAGFLNAVAAARHLDPEHLQVKDLTASQLFVAGYLAALDDYLELKAPRADGAGLWREAPQKLLDRAAKALPDDFAVQYARALVQAQAVMDRSWCEVFRIPQAVVARFPPARRNLRPGALESAQGYLAGYEEECPGSKAAAQKSREELNQIYSLAKLGTQVVAGTQAGVVVWEADRPDAPVAIRPGFICNVLGWGADVWAGCEKEVVRWNGHEFTSYLPRSANPTAEYYAPMRGAGGQLWVRLGSQLYAYDAGADRFAAVKAPWSGSPYSALVRRNGEVWWVDFLRALRGQGRTLALSSDAYPGRDPRQLVEGADGTLWVEDFESGLLRLDPTTGKFVREDPTPKCTGVGRDARGRLWVLHYTTDATVTRPGGEPQKVDLRELQYLRDLLIDGHDTWIAGWNQLLRLREDGETFGRQSFRVR